MSGVRLQVSGFRCPGMGRIDSGGEADAPGCIPTRDSDFLKQILKEDLSEGRSSFFCFSSSIYRTGRTGRACRKTENGKRRRLGGMEVCLF